MMTRRYREVMGKSIYPTHRPTLLDYAGCYGLFGILLLLSYGVLVIWEQTALLLLGVLMRDSAALQFTYMVVLLAIVFSLFGLLMVAEPYLRSGLRYQETRARFKRLAITLAALIGIGMLAQELLRMLY